MKRNNKKQPSLNDLVKEQLRIAQENKKRSEEYRKQVEEQSKKIREYCDRMQEEIRLEQEKQEQEMYRKPKKPGFITVDRSLLSHNLTKSQLN